MLEEEKNRTLSHLKTQCLPSAESPGIECGYTECGTPCEAAWGKGTPGTGLRPAVSGSLLATFLSALP